VEELSARLRVGKSTTYRWAHYEFMLHVRAGSPVSFDEKAVERWLQSRERMGRSTLVIDVLSGD
jgi:excisionase family DNA binding protein